MRTKITKKKFEQQLIERYGAEKLQASQYQEEGKLMTLYYEVLPEPDVIGSMVKHCATWMSGEGWEFDSKKEDDR